MDGLLSFLPFVIVGAIALLLGVIFVLASRTAKKRTEGMQAAADELGLAFFPEGDRQLIDQLAQFQLFSQGRSKRIQNMIHGKTEDVDVGIFDYQYTTGSGKHSHTSTQSVICFQSSRLQLPDFVLRPENLFDRIGDVFGYRDIDFDTHPAFSRSFLLRGNNEPRIRRMFSRDVLEYFEAHLGVGAEGSGSRLIYYRAAKKVRPEEVRSLLEQGFQVYSLFRDTTEEV